MTMGRVSVVGSLGKDSSKLLAVNPHAIIVIRLPDHKYKLIVTHSLAKFRGHFLEMLKSDELGVLGE
jgi:hypothetical protein